MRAFDNIMPDNIKYEFKEEYRRLEFYKNRLINGKEMFSQVDVETNTDCNRKCRICPRSINPRPHALMDDSTYDNLLRQLAEINFRGRLAPVFYNEPLLDKRLPKLMHTAKQKLPNITLMLYTNGSLLNQKNIEELVDAGTDMIIVSQYIQNLEKDDFRGKMSGLPKELRKKVRYRILNDEQKLSTRAGTVHVKNPYNKKRCFEPSGNIVLDYKGNVILCCNDYYTQHIFGNINDTHILEIWNNKQFSDVRRDLRNGRFEYELCIKCAGI